MTASRNSGKSRLSIKSRSLSQQVLQENDERNAGATRFSPGASLGGTLPPEGVYRCLRLLASARLGVREAFRPRLPHPLPACFSEVPRISPREQRTNAILNTRLEYLPDRLGRREWLERCRFSGLEALQNAVRNRRPVVLASCHVGPFQLLRFWLRAAGIPAITLIRGKSEDRSALRHLQDRFSPFPEIPTAIYQESLRGHRRTRRRAPAADGLRRPRRQADARARLRRLGIPDGDRPPANGRPSRRAPVSLCNRR